MKKMIFLTCLLLNIHSAFSQVPNWLWAKSSGGNAADSVTSSVTDAAGNTYVVGNYYSPTITFGSVTLTNASAGLPDGFIVKYSSSGAVVWARNITGTGFDYANDVCLNSSGQICVAGSFNSTTIDFGTISTTSMGFSFDLYVVKYTTVGTAVFSIRYGGGSDKDINQITADNLGNLYLAGTYQSTFGMAGATTLNSVAGSKDVFVAKVDNLCNEIWLKSIGGPGAENCKGLYLDSLKNVVVAGNFYSSSINGSSLTLTNDLAGSSDLFIARYSNSGSITLLKSPGGNFPDLCYGLITDSPGCIYISGCFYDSSVTFGSYTLTNTDPSGNTSDVFLAKYDTSGTVVWARSIQGTATDLCYNLCKGSFGYLYAIGSYYGPALNFPADTLLNISSGTTDIFVAKYDYSGNNIWATGVGGTNNDKGRCINMNAAGAIYIAGTFQSSTLPFGGTTLTNMSTTQQDIFTAKLTMSATEIESNGKIERIITVYPNPGTGIFNFDGLKDEDQIEIFDLAGRLVSSEKTNAGAASANLSDCDRGVYFYRLTNSSGVSQSGKLILQ